MSRWTRDQNATPHRKGWRVTRTMPRAMSVPCASLDSMPTRVGLGVARPIPTNRNATNTSANAARSEEHTSELQSQSNLVCRLLLEKKKKTQHDINART